MVESDRDHPTVAPLSAAILAGGRSSRMGTDKALLTLRPGGPPMAAIVASALNRLSDDVFLVSPPRPQYAGVGAPLRPDLYGETGPLGGIASAIAHARHDFCLVVSCDMPFVNVDLLRWMAQRPRNFDVLVPTLRGDSRQGRDVVFQTMHAIYGKGCLPAIERNLRDGRLQTVAFFDEVVVETVDETEVRRFDPELRSLFSVNTPEALAQARRWAQR
ncbi:MAG TPA: molybdenum cofactor guanylyltransferase [Thermomicrobiales bacterium]